MSLEETQSVKKKVLAKIRHVLLTLSWGILETWDTLEIASPKQHPQQLSSCGRTLHSIFPDMKDLSLGDAGGGGKKLESVNWFEHLRPSGDPGEAASHGKLVLIWAKHCSRLSR